MNKLHTLSTLFATAALAALTACGGGGGGDSAPAPTPSAPAPAPTATIVTFSVSGPTATEHTAVVSGETIDVTWASMNASTCALSGDASGSVAGSGQQAITAPTVTTATTQTYTVTCGAATQTGTITVLPARTVIVDAGFQQALQAQGLTVASDDTIDTKAAMAMTELKIQQDYGIVDVTGISSFQGLTKLQLEQNPTLANVSDINQLTGLTWLNIWKGTFTAIDVSRLTNLTLLGITQIDGLQTVDTSHNTQLVELDFGNDNDDAGSPWGVSKGLTSIDLSHNVNLERVYLGYNLLTTVDTSKNARLQEAWFEGNPVQSLDFSHNANVNYVLCWDCAQLTSLNLVGINGGSLPARLSLYGDTQLTTIRVSNPAQYTAWMASATLSVDNDSNGVFVDNRYNAGGLAWYLLPTQTFVQ